MKNSLYNERKYLILRKKLDDLHYSMPLQIESADLVEKLLNDLIKTSDGFQKLRKQNEELQAQIDFTERSLNPLKHDNQKLLRENNTLHTEIIEVKENALQKQNLTTIKLKQIETESKDLAFALKQSEICIKQLQDEALKNKLDTISAKVYLPSSEKGFEELPRMYINANTNSVTNISIARDIKDGQSTLIKNNNYRSQSQREDEIQRLMSSGKKEHENVDVKLNGDLKNRAVQLQDELRHCHEQLLSRESELSYLRIQVSNRDSEISRLKTRLDVGGINMVKLVTDYNQMQQNDKIKLLNHQIDYLNKENSQMDSVLKSKPYIALSQANIKLLTENSQMLEKIRYQEEKIKDYQKMIQIKYPNGRFTKHTSQNIVEDEH